MSSFTISLVLLLVSQLGDGRMLSMDPPAVTTVDSTMIMQRGDVPAACQFPALDVILAEGDFSVITSQNYPKDFDGGTKCSWKFETDSDTHLTLGCPVVALPLFSNLQYIDNEIKTEYTGFFFVGERAFKHTFVQNSAEVNFLPWWIFSGKGFSCKMEAIKKPVRKDSCQCGVKGTSRIVGGGEVSRADYNWMASIVTASTDVTFCGGSLISPKHVLTAAQCTIGKTASQIEVRLGVQRQNQQSTNVLRSAVTEISVHPGYDPVTKAYDAAVLLITEVDLTKNPHITTVCLPLGSFSYANTNADITGWGTVDPETSTPTEELKGVTAHVITNSECKDRLKGVTVPDIADQMLCAGTGYSSICKGDYGGPLVATTSLGYREVIGIASFGFKCGTGETPAVYTRVSDLSPWLETTLTGEACAAPTKAVKQE